MADPKIKYDIEANVAGQAKVEDLAADLERLSTTLEGPLRQGATDAATALRGLAEQQGALNAFAQSEQKVKAFEQQLVQASRSAKSYAAAISESGPPTAAQAATLARLTSEVDRNEKELAAQKNALKGAGDELLKYGLTGDRLIEGQRKTSAAVDQLRDSLQQTVPAWKNSADAAVQAAAARERESAAIKGALALQQSEIDLARQALTLERDQQAAIQKNAAARGDEAAAMQAANRLKGIEVEQLGLVARAKRAEAAAIQSTTDARRVELSAVGPLTQAQQQQLTIAENSAKALRTQAAASDVAARSIQAQAQASREGANATGVLGDAARRGASNLGEIRDRSKEAESGASLMGDAFKKIGPIIAASFTARQFVDTLVQAESLNRGLIAVTGNAKAAGVENEYLRETSNRLGLELLSTGQQYLSLLASTRGTALEGEKTRAVFEAITRAGSALGKSNEEVGRALTAVSQIASKGTVAMEELRGQLAEALPGALEATAKGAGITVQQLIQMVSSGDALAKDVIPALTKGLNDLYAQGGPPDTIVSNFNRLKNSITETSIALGEGGVAGGLTTILGRANVGLVRIANAFGDVGADIGEFAGAVATGNFHLFTQEERLAASEARLDKVAVASGFASKAVKEVGEASAASGNAMQESFRKSEIAAQASGGEVVKSTLAQQVAFVELAKAVEKRLEASQKGSVAAQEEAKVINLVATAFGSETDKIAANTLAAGVQSEAQTKLVAARREDLSITQQKLTVLEKEIAETKRFSPELDDQRKKLEASVETKKQELRASEAMAKQHEIEALSARTAAQAYQDNSTRLGELKYAYEQAGRAVEDLRQKQLQGKATGEEVSAAVLKQAAAQKLYADALHDTVTASEIAEKVIARKASSNAREIELNVEVARTNLAVASARGDDKAAAAAQTDILNLEVAAKRDSAQASRDEATALRVTADAKEAEARASNTLTTEKKEELAAVRASADAKDQDARKSDILADREAALAQATSQAADSFVNALERKVSAQEKLNEVMERAEALERKRLNIDKEKFSLDSSGNRINAFKPTSRGLYDQAKQQGLTDAQALSVSNKFIDSTGRQTNYGNVDASRGETWATAVQKAIDKMVLENARKGTSNPVDPAARGGRSVNVNLNFNGRTTPVAVASDADAAALQSVLQQLSAAASRAA